MRLWVPALLLALQPVTCFLAPHSTLRFATWNRRVVQLRSSVWPEEEPSPAQTLRNIAWEFDEFLTKLLGFRNTPAVDEQAEEHAAWLQTEKMRKREVVAEKGRQWDMESKLNRLLRVCCGRLADKEEAEVRRIFCELELLGQASSDNLEGTWKLLYASNKKAFPLPAGVARVLKVGDLLSSLSAAHDVFSLRLPGLPRLPLRMQVTMDGNVEAVGDNAVEVAFKRPTLVLGPLRIPYGRQKTSRLAIVYASSQFRLMRAADSSMLVFGLKANGSGGGNSNGGSSGVSEEAPRAAPAEAVVTSGGKVAWFWPL